MTQTEGPAKSSNELAGERTRMAAGRTVFAVERTLMAWIRTALSMIGFGFTIYKFLEGVDTARPDAPRNVGLFLLALGTAAASFGSFDYWQVMRLLQREEGTRFRVVPLVFGIMIGLLGAVLIVWVLIETAG